MEFIYYILFLYLTKFSFEQHLNIPENFSKVLNKLLNQTKYLDNINVTSMEEKLENASKILYLKSKAEPSLVFQIKIENFTKEGNDSINEIEEIISVEERDLDNINKFNEKSDYSNDTKAVHIEYVPKSIEYIIQSDYVSNEEDLSDIPNIENDTRRSGFLQDDAAIYPTEVNKYSFDNDFNEVQESQRKNGLVKTPENKDMNDIFNTLKLNETFEKLFKEMREIKILHRMDEEKKTNKMKVIPYTRRMPVAKPVALMPYNYMSRSLNVMPILYPPINRYRDQRKFIINPPPSMRKLNILTNKIGVKTKLMNPKITRHYFTNLFT